MRHTGKESSLVSNIIRALRSTPGVVVRKRHGSTWGVAGDPDLYGTVDGRHFEIEVKRPGGDDPTPLQEARLRQWAAAGALAGVARSVEDALRIVGWGRRTSMSVAAYSLEALREYRRRKAEASTVVAKAPLTLKDIPPDAPMEEGIVLGCWNGEAFVSWEKWLASQPVEAFREAPRDTPPVTPSESMPAQPRKACSHRAITASLFGSEGEDGPTG